ncbi:hypothetical protein KVR01_007259 [Diaporthe batatas]|uniref:uncharacterized protein n=1 Tax=Diaporthe batatas TaxID=748121 RepID=UPI001D050B80|nr:uncharacterized protein KVR01_007259 [Diaporthe batatas]KAG8162781.1 hypothetical protein KVR01_007259 [Diaporthe batatas]
MDIIGELHKTQGVDSFVKAEAHTHILGWSTSLHFLQFQQLKIPPHNNVLPQACRVLLIACSSGFRLSAAEPDFQATHHRRKVPWTGAFVGEIRRGLKACRIIACFVVFWLCYNQTSNNFVSQAGQMEQNGISNDTIQALNPIACIVMAPLIQGMFPRLRRRGFTCGPMMRMTLGFLFVAAGLAYAVGLQSLIYSRPPCFDHPLECSTAIVVDQQDGDGGSRARPNEISVWFQTPLHFLLAIGEILDLVSLSEYTYTEAPANIKAVVQALQQLAAAVAAALGMTLGPVSRDPKLVVMYASLAGIMAVSSVPFWLVFAKYDTLYEIQGVKSSGSSESEGVVVSTG